MKVDKEIKYGVVCGYHMLFIKEYERKGEKYIPLSYCKNINEIPQLSKKEAIRLCEKFNKSDYFATMGNGSMYFVYKIEEITG